MYSIRHIYQHLRLQKRLKHLPVQQPVQIGDGEGRVTPEVFLQQLVEEETRWPLTIEEMRVLLNTTNTGPVRYKMDGNERSLVYRMTVETGYRAGELRSLTRASFDLDGNSLHRAVAGWG